MAYHVGDLKDDMFYGCGDCSATTMGGDGLRHANENGGIGFTNDSPESDACCPVCGGAIDYEFDEDGEMQ